jgi:hypothetical protein
LHLPATNTPLEAPSWKRKDLAANSREYTRIGTGGKRHSLNPPGVFFSLIRVRFRAFAASYFPVPTFETL